MAAPGFRVDPFEPMPSQGTAVLGIARSDVLPHLTPSGGVLVHHASNLLMLRTSDEETGTVGGVERSTKGELWVALGLFDYVDLGLMLPIVLDQGGSDLALIGRSGQDVAGFGIADMRIVARGRFLDPSLAAGVGGALVASLTVPTGASGDFVSDGTVSFEPRLVFDWSHDLGFAFIVNMGFHVRPETRVHNIAVGHAFRWGLGLQSPSGLPGLSILGTLAGTVSLTPNRDPLDPSVEVQDGLTNPVELLAGLQYRFSDLIVQVGAGAGLTRAVGSPGMRVFATVGFTPPESLWLDDDVGGTQ